MPANANNLLNSWLKKINQRIRIFTDSGDGFGNQAASANLVGYLREKGFTGIIEFIYPDSITKKIATLFGLPEWIPEVYSQTDNLIFYTIDVLIKHIEMGKLEPITLALTGGLDPVSVKSDGGILSVEIEKYSLFSPGKGYANFLNADVFISFSQYQGIANPKSLNTQLHLRGQIRPVTQLDTKEKFIIAPQTDFSQAEDYVTSAHGELLLVKLTGLKALMKAYKNESISLIPSYGYPLNGINQINVLEIIAGARYAQLKSDMNKPIIIPVFYDLSAIHLHEIREENTSIG